MNFKKVRIVCYGFNYILYIVGLTRIGWEDIVDIVGACAGWFLGESLGLFHVIPGNIAAQGFNLLKTFLFALGKEMCVAGYFTLNTCASEFFHRNFFTKYGFYHFRAGDKHLGYFIYHKNKVGQCRRIHCPAGARPQYYTNLRNKPRGLGVAVKYFTIAGQRIHAFLNAGSTRIVDTNNRHF
ncbi:hypothetical protein DSECCO2_542450 [anaerobic digester metagenome]